jgi:hypothetical protein
MTTFDGSVHRVDVPVSVQSSGAMLAQPAD